MTAASLVHLAPPDMVRAVAKRVPAKYRPRTATDVGIVLWEHTAYPVADRLTQAHQVIAFFASFCACGHSHACHRDDLDPRGAEPEEPCRMCACRLWTAAGWVEEEPCL